MLCAKAIPNTDPHRWYTARVPGGHRIVMFFDADLSALEELLDSSVFLVALAATRHVGRRIHDGGYALSEPPITRTAASTRAVKVTGDRWLAVGDAAISFDPLSSQGCGDSASRRRAGRRRASGYSGGRPIRAGEIRRVDRRDVDAAPGGTREILRDGTALEAARILATPIGNRRLIPPLGGRERKLIDFSPWRLPTRPIQRLHGRRTLSHCCSHIGSHLIGDTVSGRSISKQEKSSR